MAEMWAPSVDDVPFVASVAPTSCLQRALRRAKGQIEKPEIEDLKTPYHSEGVPTPSASSDSLDIGDLKQALGAVHAEGGLTRNYAPIAEYEGRHRWDPRAEWTNAEEKRVVRKVSSKSIFRADGTFLLVRQWLIDISID